MERVNALVRDIGRVDEIAWEDVVLSNRCIMFSCNNDVSGLW